MENNTIELIQNDVDSPISLTSSPIVSSPTPLLANSNVKAKDKLVDVNSNAIIQKTAQTEPPSKSTRLNEFRKKYDLNPRTMGLKYEPQNIGANNVLRSKALKENSQLYISPQSFLSFVLNTLTVIFLVTAFFAYYQGSYASYLNRLYIILALECTFLVLLGMKTAKVQIYMRTRTLWHLILLVFIVWFAQPLSASVILWWMIAYWITIAQDSSSKNVRKILLIIFLTLAVFMIEYGILYVVVPVQGNRAIPIAQACSFLLVAAFFYIPAFLTARSIIQQFTKELIEKQDHAYTLKQIHARFVKKLKMHKLGRDNASSGDTKNILDMDSPITKIIMSIRAVELKNSNDPDVTEALDYAIELLSSANLLNVNLDNSSDNENANSEINSYLNSVLEKQTSSNQQSPAPNQSSNPFLKSSTPSSNDSPVKNTTYANILANSQDDISRRPTFSVVATTGASTPVDAPSDNASNASIGDKSQNAKPRRRTFSSALQLLSRNSFNSALVSAVSPRKHTEQSLAADSDSLNPHWRAAEKQSTPNSLVSAPTPTSEVAGLPAAAPPKNNTMLELQPSNIVSILEKATVWDFPIFDLQDATGGRPLYHMGIYAMQNLGLLTALPVEVETLCNFFSKIEASYQNVPYHNSTHASDVLQAMFYFMETLGLREIATVEEMFASIVACAIHDLDHPGFNNAFMVNSSSALALRYNDVAVLENYHCSTAFGFILSDQRCNILSKFSHEQFKAIKCAITSMVLATDMASHFEYVSKFKNKVSGAGFSNSDQKDRQLILNIAIKCADISNQTKSPALAQRWADLITEEFYRQGDEEKQRKLTISNFMDRTSNTKAKCNIGFIDFIIKPLYDVWDSYINEDGQFPALGNIVANRKYWSELSEQCQQLQQIKLKK